MTTQTYTQEKTHQDEEIKGDWFKNHKATLNQYGEIVVLDWQEPGTGMFYVRYVFDRNNMYVSGDLGEAVFRFTEKAIPERIARYNLDYFCEKLRAFCDPKEDFSQVKAVEYLKEMVIDHEIDTNASTYQELINIIEDCGSYDEYHVAMASFDYYKMGNDAWEWLGKLGSATPMRLRAYLIGIQMAMGK